MVTITSPPLQLQESNRVSNHVILKGVSWSTYKALMTEVGDDRVWRIAYNQGVLEIRIPLEKHEEPKRLIESFIEAIVDELEIELRSLGSLTLEREELSRGVEPDSCFYIQNESVVRGKNINLPEVPPPDLVVESDYTSSSLDKFSLYASLGVPELWRYTRQMLQVYRLVEGNYEISEQSLAFPFLPIAEIPGFIAQSRNIGQRAVVRLFRDRIREILSEKS